MCERVLFELEQEPLRGLLEAIALRLEAIPLRLEAMALRLDHDVLDLRVCVYVSGTQVTSPLPKTTPKGLDWSVKPRADQALSIQRPPR